MFEFQQYLLHHFKSDQNTSSNTSIMNNYNSDYIVYDRFQSLPFSMRERSLSPDSLERNKTITAGVHRYDATSADEDSLDENDLDHCVSNRYSRKSSHVRDTLKTLSSRGLIGNYQTSIKTTNYSKNNYQQSSTIDWDFNDEISVDSIHVDNDDLSDEGDCINGNIDSGYDLLDGYDEDEDFQFVSTTTVTSNLKKSSITCRRLNYLDTISEAASEEERRAAKSLRYQRNGTVSISASTSSTTVDDELSTLSDASISMDCGEQESVPVKQAINVLNELLNSCKNNTIMNKLSSSNNEIIKQLNEEPICKKRRFIENHILLNNNSSLMKNESRQIFAAEPGDTLERLRNITKMFNKPDDENDVPELQKIERQPPSEKLKDTFKKFEERASNGHIENGNEEEEEDDRNDGTIVRNKKKHLKEHIPYHDMADVKDKFEKGIEKPRIEKRLDFRVQSGITSTKKQQFEHGEFEQETEPHVSKVVVDTDLLSGATSERRERFEKGDLENRVEKTTTTVDIPLQSGVASEKKAKFERGDFDDHEHVQKQQVEQIPSGMATEKKQKFESGQVGNDLTLMNQRENLAKSTIEPGIAQAKRDEFMSKISSDTIQWTSDKYINIDTLEHGSATSKRKEFESLATSEFKATDKTKIEVQPGLASNIKEQYLSTVTTDSTINRDKDQQISPQIIVASGLTKERANVFENPDSDTVVKRTVEIDNDLVSSGVAKERMAMFKNLENGTNGKRGHSPPSAGDSKLRVDENGNIVRESDKREEIYFEKGQTKQLVEKWKTKQNSPDRDQQNLDVTTSTLGEQRSLKDQDYLQTGKAKNLVEMWKTMDKENTPPSERRAPRPITPPTNDQRKLLITNDDHDSSRQSYTNDTSKIESGHAKAARERFIQNVEQNNTTTSNRSSLKQVTPPPGDYKQRKSSSPSDVHNTTFDQYETNEDIIPTKGQAKNLKNRFVEYEQDAKKIETASSKVKHIPKRFVDTPAPKQTNIEPAIADNKCFLCNKTVYAMEKVEADKKVYHKSCFKCMQCKSVLKPGNFTSVGTKIYCKPHYMQLFAVKGNYSSGFGLEEHKSRWSQQQTATQYQNNNNNNYNNS